MKIICECRLFQFRWVAIWFGMIYWSTVPINGNAKSLDSAKVHWIAGAGITSSGIGVVAWVHPGLVWRNHILFAGMGQTLLSGHSSDPKPYLLGLLYQYFPNPPGRRFDLFF